MLVLLTIMFFVLGLVIGSFLNVVILRYNTSKSFSGRSACISCARTLAWYELIPVGSFCFLRGRCQTCRVKISKQYPLVELASGVVFAGLFIKFQDLLPQHPAVFIPSYFYYATLFSILIVISVYDIRHKIIPDGLVFLFSVLTFLGLFFFSADFLPKFSPSLPELSRIVVGIFAALPFAFLWLVSLGRWMGLGDAKLALGLSWILGPYFTLSAMLIAFWSGALAGVLLLFMRRIRNIQSEIPFAPFLVLGTFLAFIFNISFPF